MAKVTVGGLVQRGRVFYARWTVNGKAFQRSTGETEHDAALAAMKRIVAPFAGVGEVEALERVAARLEGRRAEVAKLMDAENPPTTVAQAWGAFIADQTRPDSGERTLDDYAALWMRFRKWIEERREGAALRDVTEADAADYAANLAAAVGASTFNKHMALLRLVFRTLHKPAKLTGDPFASIRRKRFAVESRREMTVEELRIVCQSATGELRTLLALGLYCGLRLGDAVTLQWGEVDLVRGRITRIPHKTARRNPVPVKVPIHPALAAILAETPKAARRGLVLPGLAGRHERDPSAVSKAVTAHFWNCGIDCHAPGTGRQIKRDAHGNPALTEGGKLDFVEHGKKAVVRCGFHSLRHSFVSLCREAGAPLSVVESIVGHSSPAMTQHYSHASEGAARDAVLMLPSVTVKAALPAPGAGKGKGDGADATQGDSEALRAALAGLVKAHGLEAVKGALEALATV